LTSNAMYDLNDKVAIVTGGGAGLGRAVALRLAKEGASIALIDIDLASVEMVAQEVRRMNRRALAIRADVSKASEVKSMVEETIKHFGRIDILVNNAGICPVRSFLETDESQWDTTLAVNAKSQFLCAKSVVPHMIAQGGGKIVNIGSEAGKDGFPLFVTYCASKHAVLGFTRALAKELGTYRINVNAVCPNSMSGTKMREYVDEEMKKLGSGVTATFSPPPLGRMVDPAEVAGLVAFLASKDSDMMTGQAINFTGGALTAA
jgi:NAD(P)-dependent dehydrogenase (short-subunit alcohol dehydrogenase family)